MTEKDLLAAKQECETSAETKKCEESQTENEKRAENIGIDQNINTATNENVNKGEEKTKEEALEVKEDKTEPPPNINEINSLINPENTTKQAQPIEQVENENDSSVVVECHSDPETKGKRLLEGIAAPTRVSETQAYDDEDDYKNIKYNNKHNHKKFDIYAESQPNIESYSLVRKPKATSKRTIKLSDIPTWADMAPEFLQEHQSSFSSSNDRQFPANEEINGLISYLPRGDSTLLEIDAIVNAANSGLYAGGGICGAIHHAAGRELEAACLKFGGCETGEAVVTPGFNLPSKYVIHAVGPIGEHPRELEAAYKATLDLMDGVNIRSVGLCCLSTGIYGYPIRSATRIALRVVREFLEDPKNRAKVDRIIFVVFLPKDCRVYENYLPLFFPVNGNGSESGKDDRESENKSGNGSDNKKDGGEKNEEEKIVDDKTFELENSNENDKIGKKIETPRKNEEDQLSINEESEFLEKTDDNLAEKVDDINQEAQNPDD